MDIVVTHNAGFFSCCSVKLYEIIQYFNCNKKIPKTVDSSKQFAWYKTNDIDVTYDYFKHYDNVDIEICYNDNIDYHHDYQFAKYENIDYDNICKFVKKYFTLSDAIANMTETIIHKYNIDYANTCVLFYRGNDKIRETTICGYDEYIEKAKFILDKNPNIKFLLQSDETEFIETFTALFPSNSYYFQDEIRHMKKCNNTVDMTMRDDIVNMSKQYLAITYIMSQCKYIVCGSGNCSIWILFYRENAKNVYQNLNNEWVFIE